MRPFTWCTAIAMLGMAAPLAAQDSAPSIRDVILRASRLPEVTKEARVLGVPEQDIRTILGTAREQRVPAGVLQEVLVVENEAIREHGPVDNFGAFVQAKLQQGLRGRELAAAIRAEHAARGIGKGKRLPDAAQGAGGQGRGAQPHEGGKAPGDRPDAPGRSGDAGKPDQPGKSGAGGKPESAGQQGSKGGGKGGS